MPAEIAAVAGVVGAISGARGASQAGRAAERAGAAATAAARDQLEFAKQQFEIFEPVIRQFGAFFTDVPLEEIVSGRVIARAAEPAIADINRLTEIGIERATRELGRRGLLTSGVGLASLREIEAGRISGIASVREAARRQEFEDRFRFATLGVGLQPQVGAAAAGVQQALTGVAAQQQRLAESQLGIAGRAGAAAGRFIEQGAFSGLGRFFTGGGGVEPSAAAGGLLGARLGVR